MSIQKFTKRYSKCFIGVRSGYNLNNETYMCDLNNYKIIRIECYGMNTNTNTVSWIIENVASSNAISFMY